MRSKINYSIHKLSSQCNKIRLFPILLVFWTNLPILSPCLSMYFYHCNHVLFSPLVIWLKNTILDIRRQKHMIKGLLTNFFAIFQICSKLCIHVGKEYTNESPKIQVHNLRGSWDIHIQKCVIFGGMICYFYIPNTLGASDAVCIWLLIDQSQSVIVIVKRK